jgi:transporter family-2 protein
MSDVSAAMLAALLGVGAGVSFVVQQAVNAGLRGEIASAAWAGFASYVGGTVSMVVLAAVLRDPLPSTAALSRISWWAWTGGFFGAVYIAISIFLVPRLGTASFAGLLVGGQMIASLIFDHFGAFGVPQHPVSFVRLLGAALLVVGVVLIRL